MRAADISAVFVLYPLLSGERRAHYGEILREITRLVEAGKFRPVVDPRVSHSTARWISVTALANPDFLVELEIAAVIAD